MIDKHWFLKQGLFYFCQKFEFYQIPNGIFMNRKSIIQSEYIMPDWSITKMQTSANIPLWVQIDMTIGVDCYLINDVHNLKQHESFFLFFVFSNKFVIVI